jgi:hypothetical protein
LYQDGPRQRPVVDVAQGRADWLIAADEEPRVKEDPLDKFQRGVWGLMKGGLSLVEEGHADLCEYGMGDHTVLDLLYAWSEKPVSSHRDRYISNANQQLSAMQRAWQDVVEAYAALKSQL